MSKLNWIWPCTPGRGGQSITEPLAGCVAALLPTMNSVSFHCLFPLLTPNQSKESILFQGLGVISLLRVYNLASLRALYSAQKSPSRLTAREEEQSGAYLNWQKMSAYSGRIPLACSTVTRKVNALPSFRWLPISSENPSIIILPSSKVLDFRSKAGQMNTGMVQIMTKHLSERRVYSSITSW